MSLLPPDPADVLKGNLEAEGKPKRGRPAGPDLKAVLDTIHARLDDLVLRVDALRPDPFITVLNRIAFALESIAGQPSPAVYTPSPEALAAVQAAKDVPVTPVEPKVMPSTEKPATSPAVAGPPTTEALRGAAVAFVEKWGRDVLVGILSKHSPSGKLADLRDPEAFLTALDAYEKKAGG